MSTDPVNSDSSSAVLRFAWLVNPGQPPQHNVRLTVEHGIVTDIGRVPADEIIHIQQAALLPALVNAHTHLEFSALSAPLPPPKPFTDWIGEVIRYRAASLTDDLLITEAVQSGLQQCRQQGVGLIGEITTSAAGAAALHSGADAIEANRPTVISFRELIGFGPDRIAGQMQLAEQHVHAIRQGADSITILPGVSPHAPYSVHPEIVQGVCRLAQQWPFPVAMHLAETAAEVQLLTDRTGPFVDFLQRLNLWDTRILHSIESTRDYLELLATTPHALAVHGNYLTDEEILFLQRHPQIAVVYCPRTHAWFGHQNHPWQRLQAGGGTVILGTDSRASNPDLNVWAELQLLAANTPDCAIWDLLPMITTTAAAALGLPPEQHTIRIAQPLRAVKLPCTCDSETSLQHTLIQTNAVPQLL